MKLLLVLVSLLCVSQARADEASKGPQEAKQPVVFNVGGKRLTLNADGSCVGDLDAFEQEMRDRWSGGTGAEVAVLAWLVVREVRRTGGCQPEQAPPAP